MYLEPLYLAMIFSVIATIFTMLVTLVYVMASQLERLQRAAILLYLAGYWKAEGVSAYEANLLWVALRDAAGLKPGTATSLGIGDPKA